MLPSNGLDPKTFNNYHMALDELKLLLRVVQKHYDPMWYLGIILQFSFGMRASEMLHIQVSDFSRKFTRLTYRQAKTNRIIYNEPVLAPVSELVINYIYHNQHRLKNGWLFPGKNNGPMLHATYASMWSKWRRKCSKVEGGEGFLEHYNFNSQVRYRISSHSLRRLHRTVLHNSIQDLYIVKELCNYSDYKSLQRYINEQEIQLKKEDYMVPVLEPIVSSIHLYGQGQRSMQHFI